MRAFLLFASLALGACGARLGPLPYTPAVTLVSGSGQVAVGAVTDTRGRSDPSFYGIVRGGVGQPLKTVQTAGPVSASVRKALTDALAARGMAAPAGTPLKIEVRITQFDTNRYVRMESKVTLLAQVFETATGRVVFESAGRANKVSGSLLSLDGGIFASTEELAQQMTQAMSEAIDQIVDDAGFRRAVAGRPGA